MFVYSPPVQSELNTSGSNHHFIYLQTFNGNSGRRDIVKHSLLEIAVASFIRFRPISAMVGVALRVELYGVIAFRGTAYLSSW